MASTKVILITGANRGIGRGLVANFLKTPSNTVVAAVRNLDAETTKSLADLPKGADSKLIVVKIDSAHEHHIEALDIVIANAGLSRDGAGVTKTSSASAREHFDINAIAPMLLLQAAMPLLKKSKDPKFVAISSLLATITGMEMLQPLPRMLSPYGASKAALNWFLRRVHFEEDWLITFVFHPGLVLTDMAAETFENAGVNPQEHNAITVEESAAGITKNILSATREVSGTFIGHDGKPVPW
ncbi:hypothetical protein FSARC_13832 [Fusarium sarcochroum]|uniref:Uncharacterized protein n=1 Tax=Fusarium sarcochroum TaxID=1208366 RepID=A0A8H4SYD2_9HYPO|nr:hypothetical protein FSARC_13832 [Fusarium sarcochroum]